MTIFNFALIVFLIAAGLVFLGFFVPVMSIVAGIAAIAAAIALIAGK